MRNIEFKAELRDFALGRSIAEAIGAKHIAALEQTDTYYRVPSGRLKKRETVGQETEWIVYHRPDEVGLKVSDFAIYSEQDARERFGEAPMPVWVVVKKRRELYLFDHVRIHLDRVEGLGDFLEFEALVRPGKTEADGHAALRRLRADFAPALGEPIAASYSDLLTRG